MKIKYILPITLFVVLVTSCSAPTSSSGHVALPNTGNSSNTLTSSSSSSDIESDGIVSIYSVNDFHGKVEATDNYMGLAALQGGILNNTYYEPSSIIISAGDMWQGSYISGYDKGKSTTELMNNFPFEAMALGNHEFDWGIDIIKQNQDTADFPFLCANLIDQSSGKRPDFIRDHVILEAEGYKIGVVGAIGAYLEDDISSEMIKGYEFSDDLSILQTAYDSCINEGADVVLLALHDDQDSTYTDDIQYSGIPFIGIFGGHSHRFQNDDIPPIPYVQGGRDGEGYSCMVINFNTKSLESFRYEYINYGDENYADQDFVKAVNDLIASRPPETVGYLQGNWNKTNSGNLVTRAMFEMAKKYFPDKEYDETNLLAYHNSGGIRGSYPSSSEPLLITMADIQIVSPFDNRVVLLPERNVRESYISSGVFYPKEISSSIRDIITINYVIDDSSDIFYSEGSQTLENSDGSEYIIYDLIADYIRENSSETSPLKAEYFNY